MKLSPSPQQGGRTPFPAAHSDGTCQALHEQRSGSRSHGERSAERPHAGSRPLRRPRCRGPCRAGSQRMLCNRAVPAHPELLGSLPCPELLSTQPLWSRHSFSARPIYKTPLPKTCFGQHEPASHHQLQQPSCTARRCST